MTLRKFEKVALNFHTDIYQAIFSNQPKIEKEKQLIQDMKIFGESEEPYTANLQKKEFGEFINLIIHQHDFSSNNISTTILQAKQKLLAHGVKLKI